VIACLFMFLGTTFGQITVKNVWIDTLKPGWEEQRDALLRGTSAPVLAKDSSSHAVPVNVVPSAPLASVSVRTMVPSPPVVGDTTWTSAIPDSILVPNLAVRQSELRDVLSALAMQHGINLVIDPSVTGQVSLSLRNLKLRDVFRWIVQENGLVGQRTGAVLKIYRPAPVVPVPVEPLCLVTKNGELISLDAQGIALEKVLQALSKEAGLNVLADGGAGSPTIRLRLNPLKPAVLMAMLAENAGLDVRERQGVFVLSRLEPRQSSGAVGGSLQLWIEQDTLVSLDAAQVPLQDAVTALARKLSVNLVVLGNLQGSVTMKVAKTPFEQVLGFFFAGTSYTWWKRDGAWVVGPSETPGVTNSDLILLKHLRAEEAMDLIPQSIQKNVQLRLVKSHNGIMCLGSRESIDGIRKYVEKVDYPVPQILIEALVVDINMNKVRNIGVNIFTNKAGIGKSTGQIYPSFDQSYKVDNGNSLLSGVPGLRDVVSLPKDFYLRVKALEQEQILTVRSRPQISTLNGTEAMITVGQTQYFLLKSETDLNQVSGSTVRTTQKFEKIEANVTLTVTPFVTGKDEVTCDIVPDFTEPEGALDANTPPTLNHRLLKSKVRLRDGETIVLGGLIKEANNVSYDQVPILGSIPVLGWLFKNRTTTLSRNQLLIFVTPHIYYGKDAAVDPVKVLRELEP